MQDEHVQETELQRSNSFFYGPELRLDRPSERTEASPCFIFFETVSDLDSSCSSRDTHHTYISTCLSVYTSCLNIYHSIYIHRINSHVQICIHTHTVTMNICIPEFNDLYSYTYAFRDWCVCVCLCVLLHRCRTLQITNRLVWIYIVCSVLFRIHTRREWDKFVFTYHENRVDTSECL